MESNILPPHHTIQLLKYSVGDIETKLTRFLFHNRTTPHSTTGLTPAEMLMGRHLRTNLDLIKPNLAAHIRTNQVRQKFSHDQHSHAREFQEGQLVLVRKSTQTSPWIAGTIYASKGPLSYEVVLDDNRIVRRHIDQIRLRSVTLSEDLSSAIDDIDLPVPSNGPTVNQDTEIDLPISIPLSRSLRVRKCPDRFQSDQV